MFRDKIKPMKLNPKTAGLLQAIGLALYVGLFVIIVQFVQQWFMLKAIAPHPIFGTILFLLAFVISALICGSLVFVYPASLFFGNREKEAIEAIIWTAIWLIFLFIILLIFGFTTILNKN